MIVDEKNKLMYCELPKVGSSNWKRVMIKLTDDRFDDVRSGVFNMFSVFSLIFWPFQIV